MNKIIVIKLHQKSVYKDKNKKHRAFDAEVNDSDDDDFFLNLKKKRKSVMKLLFCLRKLSVKCLNLNELHTLNSSHT